MHKRRFPLTEDDLRTGLKPPQFGMGVLFGVMAAAAMVIAAFQALGPLWAFVLTLMLLAVAGHVAGNAIGTKLRDQGSKPSGAARAALPRRAESHHFAPTTQLSHKQRLGALTLLISGAFAVAGALVGGTLLARINWDQATPANITLAATSCGVLGGLWGFWVCSFAKVFLQAWREALKHEKSNRVSSTPNADQLLRSKPRER